MCRNLSPSILRSNLTVASSIYSRYRSAGEYLGQEEVRCDDKPVEEIADVHRCMNVLRLAKAGSRPPVTLCLGPDRNRRLGGLRS